MAGFAVLIGIAEIDSDARRSMCQREGYASQACQCRIINEFDKAP